MRIEDAGPRTWLLAAVALWAVCTLLLAVAGLGGQVRPLAEDPALLQPLPATGSAASSPEGPPQYSAIIDRPLFAHDRRHRPFLLEAETPAEPEADRFDVVLTSVLITPRIQMAIVQPAGGGDAFVFKVGESATQAPDWTLVSVAPRSATFAGPEGERVLELRVFDGVGGQPPTAARAPAASAQGGEVPDAAEPPGAQAQEDITPASRAEAIRRRIEARRARLREQQAPAAAQENP